MKKSISEIISALHLGEMTTAEAATSLVKIAKEGGSGALTRVADLALSNENANLVQDIFLFAKDCNLKPLVKRIEKIRNFVLTHMLSHTKKARWEALARLPQTELDCVLLAQELFKYDFYKPLVNAVPLRVFNVDARMCAFRDSDDLARAIACAVAHKNKDFMFDLDAAWEAYAGDRTLLLRCVRSVFTA